MHRLYHSYYVMLALANTKKLSYSRVTLERTQTHTGPCPCRDLVEEQPIRLDCMLKYFNTGPHYRIRSLNTSSCCKTPWAHLSFKFILFFCCASFIQISRLSLERSAYMWSWSSVCPFSLGQSSQQQCLWGQQHWGHLFVLCLFSFLEMTLLRQSVLLFTFFYYFSSSTAPEIFLEDISLSIHWLWHFTEQPFSLKLQPTVEAWENGSPVMCEISTWINNWTGKLRQQLMLNANWHLQWTSSPSTILTWFSPFIPDDCLFPNMSFNGTCFDSVDMSAVEVVVVFWTATEYWLKCSAQKYFS